MTPPPATAYEDRSVRFASARNVLYAAWRDPPDRARAVALRALQKRVATAHGELVSFHVINAGDTSPLSLSNDGRRELTASLREVSAPRAVVAMAIEGSSFFVAAWRSILSTVILVARPAFPFKIFATRAEAAAWTARETAAWKTPAPASELLDAIAVVETGLLPP